MASRKTFIHPCENADVDPKRTVCNKQAIFTARRVDISAPIRLCRSCMDDLIRRGLVTRSTRTRTQKQPAGYVPTFRDPCPH